MPLTDPLGDMLTRIRNGQQARKDSVVSPASKLRARVLDVLQREGYIRGYSEEQMGPAAGIRIELKYFEGQPAIKHVARVSKPGRRIYSGAQDLPRVRNGLGITIVSTPRGVLSDAEAREQTRQIGGMDVGRRGVLLVEQERGRHLEIAHAAVGEFAAIDPEVGDVVDRELEAEPLRHLAADRGFAGEIDGGGVLGFHIFQAREDDAERLFGTRVPGDRFGHATRRPRECRFAQRLFPLPFVAPDPARAPGNTLKIATLLDSCHLWLFSFWRRGRTFARADAGRAGRSRTKPI